MKLLLTMVLLFMPLSGASKELPVENSSIVLRDIIESATPVIETPPEFEEVEYEEEILYETYSVSACNTYSSSFKSYMDYRMITDTSSAQYQLQLEAYTENGFRKLNNRYMVAMASEVVGTEINIYLDSGELIPVIVGDVKAGTLCSHPDGSVMEFIVDEDTMDQDIRFLYGNFNIMFPGNIQTLEYYY